MKRAKAPHLNVPLPVTVKRKFDRYSDKTVMPKKKIVELALISYMERNPV